MNNNIIRIHVLRCGIVELDEALPIGIRSKNPFAYLGIFQSLKHRIKVPVFTYLIEHPKGIFLIDTGYPIEIRSDSTYG